MSAVTETYFERLNNAVDLAIEMSASEAIHSLGVSGTGGAIGDMLVVAIARLSEQKKKAGDGVQPVPANHRTTHNEKENDMDSLTDTTHTLNEDYRHPGFEACKLFHWCEEDHSDGWPFVTADGEPMRTHSMSVNDFWSERSRDGVPVNVQVFAVKEERVSLKGPVGRVLSPLVLHVDEYDLTVGDARKLAAHLLELADKVEYAITAGGVDSDGPVFSA